MDNLNLINPQPKTLLVVDDAVDNLQMLTALLKDEYQIRVAKNGEQALRLLEENPNIDLILMDVMMPVMDGFTACTYIKRNPSLRQIPVIFLTALNDVSDETKGLACGGADFISKPFNSEVVKARIRIHLALRDERLKSDALLKILLPEAVIRELKTSGRYTPEIHRNTSIMFCDLVDFTAITERLTPEELVNELTDIFTEFDEIVQRNKGVRIKTLGDGYMAATGIGKDGDAHAQNLVNAGLEIIEYLRRRNHKSATEWLCRIGIHSGQIISGIIGKSRCQFDIMGDDVNIAARVEQNGAPMTVTATEATAQLLDGSAYRMESLGRVELKGKGVTPLLSIAPR